MAWTLYDFPTVSKQVGGGNSQKHLGIIDKNGRLKGSALLLAEEWQFSTPHLTFADRFLKPFYFTASIIMGIMGLGVILFIRRFEPTFAGWVVDPLTIVYRSSLQGVRWVWNIVVRARRFVFGKIKLLIYWILMPFRLMRNGLKWIGGFVSAYFERILAYLWDLRPFIFIQKIGTNILVRIKRRRDALKKQLESDDKQE